MFYHTLGLVWGSQLALPSSTISVCNTWQNEHMTLLYSLPSFLGNKVTCDTDNYYLTNKWYQMGSSSYKTLHSSSLLNIFVKIRWTNLLLCTVLQKFIQYFSFHSIHNLTHEKLQSNINWEHVVSSSMSYCQKQLILPIYWDLSLSYKHLLTPRYQILTLK